MCRQMWIQCFSFNYSELALCPNRCSQPLIVWVIRVCNNEVGTNIVHESVGTSDI